RLLRNGKSIKKVSDGNSDARFAHCRGIFHERNRGQRYRLRRTMMTSDCSSYASFPLVLLGYGSTSSRGGPVSWQFQTWKNAAAAVVRPARWPAAAWQSVSCPVW